VKSAGEEWSGDAETQMVIALFLLAREILLDQAKPHRGAGSEMALLFLFISNGNPRSNVPATVVDRC
jgi:hypothetical protein